MPYTNDGANICQRALAGNAISAATRYLALYVGDPTSSGVEVSATGYSRLSRTAAQLPVTNNGISTNMGEWDDSANASWGTPTYVALMSASSGGDVLAYGQLSPAISEIVTGTRVFTEAGDITFTIPLS